MRPVLFVTTCLFGVAVPSTADAQLLSERLEGMYRICAYPGPPGFTNDTNQVHERRVGMGQDCPATYPEPGRQAIIPPTAMLVRADVVAGVRNCVYEQDGIAWTRRIPVGRRCPIAAGMLPREPRTPAAR